MLRFILLLSLLITFSTQAADLDIELSNGTQIPITQFTADSDSILLWLPPEYGLHGKEPATAEFIAKLGMETWIADIHSGYFIPYGRRSLDNIPIDDIVELITIASANNTRRVYLFSAGRAAALALQAARQLQLNAETRSIIAGAVFFHPNLYADTPDAGQTASYHPIAYASNLPIYIAQPALSGKSWQLNTISEHLQTGGSDVFTQILAGVSDGFNLREPDDERAAQLTQRVPYIVTKAVKLLGLYNQKERLPAAYPSITVNNKTAALKTGLQPYSGDINNPSLQLNDLNNQHHNLDDYRGQVVLLNFWATWCPPCVKELPSMSRLNSRIGSEQFSILAIDVGEQQQDVEKFLKDIPVNYPVLIDSEGDSVYNWNLLAFPTSFLLDKKGQIRYGLFGGLEWDNDDVVAIVERLLEE